MKTMMSIAVCVALLFVCVAVADEELKQLPKVEAEPAGKAAVKAKVKESKPEPQVTPEQEIAYYRALADARLGAQKHQELDGALAAAYAEMEKTCAPRKIIETPARRIRCAEPEPDKPTDKKEK